MSDNIGFPPEKQSQWPGLGTAPSPGHLLCQVWVTIYSVIFLFLFIAKCCQVSKLYCVWKVSPNSLWVPRNQWLKCWPAWKVTCFNWFVCYFRMTSKPIELDPYHHGYACACLGWKCYICNEEAKDQIGIEEQFLADDFVVFTDDIDRSKWVFCTTCKKAYHLQCVTYESEQHIKASGWPLPVHSMNVRVPNFKWVNLTRSTNWVTKQVTYVECLTNYCSTMKQKFSKKGKGGKVHKTPQEKKDAMSHKNQKNQRR